MACRPHGCWTAGHYFSLVIPAKARIQTSQNFKVAAYCSRTKHVGCLDSGLRRNDGVEIEKLTKK